MSVPAALEVSARVATGLSVRAAPHELIFATFLNQDLSGWSTDGQWAVVSTISEASRWEQTPIYGHRTLKLNFTDIICNPIQYTLLNTICETIG